MTLFPAGTCIYDVEIFMFLLVKKHFSGTCTSYSAPQISVGNKILNRVDFYTTSVILRECWRVLGKNELHAGISLEYFWID